MARFRYTEPSGSAGTADTVEQIAAAIAAGSLDPAAQVEDLETGQMSAASALAALANPDLVMPSEPDEEALAAFIGPFWQRYYRDALAKRTFNGAAALAPFWLAWRGFVGTQVLAMVMYVMLMGAVTNMVDTWGLRDLALFSLMLGAPYLFLALVEGYAANSLLMHKARRTWAKARARNLDRAATLTFMRKKGGVSVANVIVLPALTMGLVYWLVFNTFGHHDHSMAYVAAMKSDLRNLVTAQESYFADQVTYTTSQENMMFMQSTGVTVRIGSVSGTGWNATATHNGSPDQMCAIYVGSAPPPIAGATEGEPKCERHQH